MPHTTFTRRSFLGASALGSAAIFVRSLKAADFTFVQFHNQAATSSLHRRLVEMWAAIRVETSGRVQTEVFPENRGLQRSDPAALQMLQAGEIQFFTLMGGILANVVPSAAVQQVPFSFRSATEAHKAMDGALGAYLRQEMAGKGLYGFPVGVFDNGMRQIASAKRPIVAPGDLVGLKMRIPMGEIFADTFRALGAETVTLNVNEIYNGLKTGAVDAQENPLAVVDLFKLYEVVRYVSMTNHMWSGFNLMAHLATWKKLPDDIKAVIERNAAKYVRAQRVDQANLNASLRAGLARRGLIFNEVAQPPFRLKLSGLYAIWKGRLSKKCWSLLQAATNI